MNKSELKDFLVEAKKATYAAGDDIEERVNPDKSTTFLFEDGDWKYHDNYFGGEPYGGREVVHYKGNPVYIMTYYGNVKLINSIVLEQVYEVLMGALGLITSDYPYRGPERFEKGDFVYTNSHEGEIDNFSGEESIVYQGQEVYRAKYMGGFVDVEN